jgi:prevent-host-death family protein
VLHFYDVSSCDGGEIIMQTVPLSQLKSDLSQLIHLVEAGEDIAITRRGALVARLVP